VVLAHGNSPLAVAMSLLDQGSVVKVQFFAKKVVYSLIAQKLR
jgi:hypothetical protein